MLVNNRKYVIWFVAIMLSVSSETIKLLLLKLINIIIIVLLWNSLLCLRFGII